jgi:hypothetical protein
MTTLVQPTATIAFKLPNGIALRAEAHARMIKSSQRVDAKSIAIDWGTIYASIKLDSEEWFGPLIVKHIDMQDADAEYYLDKVLPSVATALGSIDYAQTMEDAMFLAVSKVLDQRAKAA